MKKFLVILTLSPLLLASAFSHAAPGDEPAPAIQLDALPSLALSEEVLFKYLSAEIADQRIQGYQSAFNQNDNGDLGVLYLMKNIDKDEMKKELAKRELKRNKHLAIRAVLEMFVTTSTMMLNNIVNEPPKNPVDFENTMEEYRNLKKYVNESLMLVSRQKNCSVPQIGISSYNKPNKETDTVLEQNTWSWLPFNKVAPKTKVVKKKETTIVKEENDKDYGDTDDEEVEDVE